jgi:hypothetical protein
MQTGRLGAAAVTLVFALTFIVLDEGTAQAYLDGGTGAMLLQMIIGSIAAAALSIKIFWNRITDLVRRIFLRTGSPE